MARPTYFHSPYSIETANIDTQNPKTTVCDLAKGRFAAKDGGFTPGRGPACIAAVGPERLGPLLPESLSLGDSFSLAQLPKVASQATGLDTAAAEGIGAGADAQQQGRFLGAEGGAQVEGVAQAGQP